MQRNIFFMSLLMLPAQAIAHPGHDDTAMSLPHYLSTIDHFTAMLKRSSVTTSLLCLGVLILAISAYKVAVQLQASTKLAMLFGGITAVIGAMMLAGVSA